MRNRLVITVLFTLLITHFSYGQKYFQGGFVVRSDGDTTRGLVKIYGAKSSPKGCYFRTEAKGVRSLLTPPELAAFGIERYRTFKAVALKDSVFFAQILVAGKVSLYSNGNIFFAEKENRLHALDMYRLESQTSVRMMKRYVGTLNMLMSDCPALKSDIETVSLAEASLVSLVQKYNACMTSSSVVYKSDLPGFTLNVQVFGGMVMSQVSTAVGESVAASYGYLNLVSFKETTPIFGAGFTLSSPRVSRNFSVDVEARYMKNSFRDQVIYSPNFYDHKDITLEFSTLIIPLTVRYELGLSNSVSLFARGGVMSSFFLNTQFVTIETQSTNPNGPQNIKDELGLYSNQLGFTGGVGVEAKLNKFRIFLDTRVEKVGSLLNAANVRMINDVYSLSLGLKF